MIAFHALLCRLLLGAVLMACARASMAEPTNAVTERVGVFFSRRVMNGINDNDARAAVKMWVQTIMNQAGVRAVPYSEIGGLDEVLEGLRAGRIHAATTPTDDYFAVSKIVPTHFLFLPLSGGTPCEEYLLLTRVDSGLTNIADLKGRKMMALTTHRMSLADLWLNVVLARGNQPPIDSFFGEVRRELKPANVVLPVFFRNADVCLITRNSFNVMTEMNPQVGKMCREILRSPKVVPNVLFFNRREVTPFGDEIRKGLLELHLGVAGRQMLDTFQLDRLVKGTDEDLVVTRDLVMEHERLCKPAALAAQGAEPSKGRGP